MSRQRSSVFIDFRVGIYVAMSLLAHRTCVAEADHWNTSIGVQTTVGDYANSVQRDQLNSRGVVASTESMQRGGVELGFNSIDVVKKQGIPTLEQTEVSASAHAFFRPAAIPGRITARIDWVGIHNNDRIGGTDGVTAQSYGLAWLTRDELRYFDLSYARSQYPFDLVVSQWTPAIGFASAQRQHWWDLRAYFIEVSRSARAAGRSSTSALEARWTYWPSHRRVFVPNNLTASVLIGRRIFAFERDLGSVTNLADLERGEWSLTAEWRLRASFSLLAQLGQRSYTNEFIADSYQLNYAYLRVTKRW